MFARDKRIGPYTYVYLVENVREEGRTKQRIIANLGRKEVVVAYGVGGNSRRLRWFANQVVRVWRKWLSRRDRQGVVRWARFNELLARHPLPSVKILHGYAAASESLS